MRVKWLTADGLVSYGIWRLIGKQTPPPIIRRLAFKHLDPWKQLPIQEFISHCREYWFYGRLKNGTIVYREIVR